MLILRRKKGECLVIVTPTGDEIRITIHKTGESAASLRVNAPEGYDIVREEILKDWIRGRDGNKEKSSMV